MKKMLATLALILVGSAAFAGAQGGPQSTIERVKANSTDRYEIVFVGGQQAEVIIDGDNDTDLDLYIYDENGNLIEKDDDNLDLCICTWTPKWTGKFIIKVVNLGDVYNEYKIRTN